MKFKLADFVLFIVFLLAIPFIGICLHGLYDLFMFGWNGYTF